MADNLLRLGTADLSHLEDIVVMRSSNPMSFTYLAFSKTTGFSGGICINSDRLPLEDCARKLDEAAADPYADVPFMTIADSFPDPFLQKALLRKEPVNGYDADQVAAVSNAILARVPERAISTMQHGEDVMEWVSYFSSGDQEARLQAVMAFPMSKHLIRENETILALIDARQPIGQALQEALSLDAEKYKFYAGVEAKLSAQALTIESDVALRKFMDPMRYSQELTRKSARHLRPDQIPEDQSGILAMNMVVKWAEDTALNIGAGMGPFSRFLRRIKPDQWEAAKDRLNGIIPKTEARDFIRTISNSITYAVVAEKIAQAGVDVPALAISANKLWAKEEIEDIERLRLDAMLKGFEGMNQYIRSLSTIVAREIGENMSLKDLKEFQARWHHVRHTLDNQVLAIKEEMEWPPLVGSFEAGGYTFRELHKSADLNEQGRKESHCVGGYSSIILSATKSQTPVIFSIEKDDTVISTIEMHARVQEEYRGNKVRTSIGWSINQNKAARNASPGAEGFEAAGILKERLEQIPRKEMFAYLQGIQSNTSSIKERLQRIITVGGCNILNEDLPVIGITTYDEVMPKALRGISASDWAERISREGGDAGLTAVQSKTEIMRKLIDEIETEVSPAGPGA